MAFMQCEMNAHTCIKEKNINGYHDDPADGFYLRKDEDALSDLKKTWMAVATTLQMIFMTMNKSKSY